jgi:hypothetical protein
MVALNDFARLGQREVAMIPVAMIQESVRVMLHAMAWLGCIAVPVFVHGQASSDGLRGDSHRVALERSLELLRNSVDRYPEHRQCFSCHHQSIPLVAFRSAHRRSARSDAWFWGKDTERVASILELTRTSLEADRRKLQTGEELDGRGLTLGYALWTADIGQADWGELRSWLLELALQTQQSDGRWRIHSVRPPAAASDAMATALVVSGLVEEVTRLEAGEATLSRRNQFLHAIWNAKRWMLQQPEPGNTEDSCGQLWLAYLIDGNRDPRFPYGASPEGDMPSFGLGGYGGQPDPSSPILGWSPWLKANVTDEEAQSLRHRESEWNLNRQRERLLAEQNLDGGWGQSSERDSDAYSTAMSLLLWAQTSDDYKFGPFRHPNFQRGIAYLIRTQHEDGSWHVSSRASPVQEYFDNGDPHDTDQFISIMATGWSAAALANAWYGRTSPLGLR